MNAKRPLRYLACYVTVIVSAGCIILPAAARTAQRTTLSLDGQWGVEDSIDADAMPKVYRHTAPVPGPAHSAMPVFADVDQYQSRELLFESSAPG
jgi:hypothetical protein